MMKCPVRDKISTTAAVVKKFTKTQTQHSDVTSKESEPDKIGGTNLNQLIRMSLI